MNQRRRGSGILLHITSLPSSYGVGDLGPGAYAFADFLGQTKQSCWQVLPLNPTSPIYGNSPYSSISALAGNTLLISWGLRREDQDFLASVNSILAKWRNDGTLDKVLIQWVPYVKRVN